MSQSTLPSYRELVASGKLEADPQQVAAAKALRQVARDLKAWKPGGGGFGLGALLGRKRQEAPQGLYIHGPVGSGKTMLMDMFFNRVTFTPRKRFHFHEFMSMAQDRLNAARKSAKGDPVVEVGKGLANEARLLCFDEIHLTNIADAMIVGRLFQSMIDEGAVIVATSNVQPDGLYAGGLNRQNVVPFIELIKARMTVIELAAAKDFRLAKLAGRQLYFSPSDVEAERQMRAVFERLTGMPRGEPLDIDIKGRRLHVPEAGMGVARFEFADLCVKPLGALDYLAIARSFHTVMISGIPKLSPQKKDEARRFVNLIDTLYDGGVCLIAAAEAEPHQLYPEGDVAFLFERTASRLIEMRSAEYMKTRKHRAGLTSGEEAAEAAEAAATEG